MEERKEVCGGEQRGVWRRGKGCVEELFEQVCLLCEQFASLCGFFISEASCPSAWLALRGRSGA